MRRVRRLNLFVLLLGFMMSAACSHQHNVKTPSHTANTVKESPKPPWARANESKSIQLAWPVSKGVLFRTFDQTPTRLHEGLSIGAPQNTPVAAAQSGEVIFAEDAQNHFGKMIIIKHDDAFVSIYAHLEAINVSVGKKVKKGQIIGTVGSSGGVESPRVYFQVRKDRLPVNPELYLSKSS